MTFTRSACGSCGHPSLLPFLNLGASPLADAFPETPDAHETYYALRLGVCESCWLVQLLDVVPDATLYNGDYGFYTGASPSSIDYFRQYAEWTLSRFPDQAHRLTVEIASNDGTLLRHFAQAGCPTLGVEPASNVAAVARDAGLEVLVEPFGRKAASKIVSVLGHAGLVIANNVAAHVADLDDFLGGISMLLASDGVAVIEVQYVADLLTGNQFDHVYHEHRFYFSVSSLATALARHGLCIDEWHRTPTQGGSIRAVVRKGDAALRVDSETWLRRPAAYGGVQGRVEHIRSGLRDLIDAEWRLGRPVAGYAASAKSTTLLNYCGIGPEDLRYVLDTTPAKIGRYTPGTHIPIVAEGDTDTYLLLAWNYLPGVLRRERAFLDGGGRFIVPIPQPVLL